MSGSNSQERSHEHTFEELVNVVHAEITKKVREEHPDLITDTFEEAMRFFSHIPSSRNLVECWWQVFQPTKYGLL